VFHPLAENAAAPLIRPMKSVPFSPPGSQASIDPIRTAVVLSAMYPSTIERYYRPRDLESALQLRATHLEGCMVLAGGQSLLPQMKSRELAPSTLIDLNRVAGLDQVECGDDVIRIGALVRHRTIERDTELAAIAQVLADAATAVGDLQVRNRGTLVGSLCQLDPTGDIAPAAIALGAHLRIAGVADSRLVPVAGLTPLSIAANELATYLEFRRPPAGSGGAYLKYGRVAQDRAIIGVAVQIEFAPNGHCRRAAVVIGGVNPGPQLALGAAQTLVNGPLDRPHALAAGELAAREIPVQTDTMASADYRRELIALLVARALLQTVESVGQGQS